MVSLQDVNVLVLGLTDRIACIDADKSNHRVHIRAKHQVTHATLAEHVAVRTTMLERPKPC